MIKTFNKCVLVVVWYVKISYNLSINKLFFAQELKMEKVKFGTTFKVNPYTWREVINFGEVVQDDKPFAGDLNERYTKFCFDFKNVKPSTLVDYDVLETFYGDLLNRASIDYLEGEYDTDDEDDVFIRTGGKYFHEKAKKLALVHKSLKQ